MTQAEQVKAMVGFRGVDVLSREADRNCQEMRYIRRLDRVEFRFADGSQITIVAGRRVSVK